MLAACGKKQEEAPTVTTPVSDVSSVVSEAEPEPEPENNRNPLTGEVMDEKLVGQRPLTFMMSNDINARPQYGLSQADVIYEAPMEGEETRFMLAFQDYSDLKLLMPSRSARHYFVYWARGLDSIYSHYGQSWLAKPKLSKIDDLNGMDGALGNVTYFRDPSRRMPHNAYTNTDGILAGIKLKNYDTEHKEGFENGFVFNTDDENEIELTDGENAKVFDTGYYRASAWFVYDKKDKVYKRYQWGEAHKDANNDKQLAVKNIIVQTCDSSVADEKHGYLDVKVIGEGTGYYLTNGKAEKITWKKKKSGSPTHYYDEEGNEVVLNQGKTWICAVKSDKMDRVGFYKTEDEMKEARNGQG
jgi:hypothetical protein